MRGIIQREYTKYRASKGLPNQSVRYIGEAELQDIYGGNYWKPMLGDLWPKGPDQIVFDIAVNSGTGRAPQIMRAAMGNPTGGIATLARLHAVARQDRHRQARLRQARELLPLALHVLGVRPRLAFPQRPHRGDRRQDVPGGGERRRARRPPARGDGRTEQGQPQRKGRGRERNGRRRRGAGAGASDAATWDWTVWLTIGLSVAAAVALTLLLVWLWRKHGERAKAYAAAIVGTLETDLGSVLGKVKAAT